MGLGYRFCVVCVILCETAKYKNLKLKLLMAIEIAIDGLTNISPLVFTFSEHDRRSLWTGLFFVKKKQMYLLHRDVLPTS